MKNSLRKIFLTLGCVAALAASAAKPNVYFDYFWYPAQGVTSHWVENLRNNIIEASSELKRVNIIDVDSQPALQIEEERRHLDNAAAGEDLDRMAVMTQEGANYLVNGRVTSWLIKEHKKTDGTIDYYSAEVNVTLKVIDPSNGTLLGTKNLSLGTGFNPMDMCTGSSPDDASSDVGKVAKRKIRNFIEDSFKISGPVLEIAEEKKDEAKKLYLGVGSEDGVADGILFTIAVEREVAGRKSMKAIGEVKVKDVEGADLSLVEVKKGGKEILAAIKAGQTLTANSKARGNNPW